LLYLKAQGQTFKKCGVFLKEPVFSHGQLYVAFSRVSNFESLKVFIENHESKQGNFLPNKYYTQNIVFRELVE
jgi:ATP-dependent DNA helicase PIF1